MNCDRRWQDRPDREVGSLLNGRVSEHRPDRCIPRRASEAAEDPAQLELYQVVGEGVGCVPMARDADRGPLQRRRRIPCQRCRERIVIEMMTSDRKLEASTGGAR